MAGAAPVAGGARPGVHREVVRQQPLALAAAAAGVDLVQGRVLPTPDLARVEDDGGAVGGVAGPGLALHHPGLGGAGDEPLVPRTRPPLQRRPAGVRGGVVEEELQETRLHPVLGEHAGPGRGHAGHGDECCQDLHGCCIAVCNVHAPSGLFQLIRNRKTSAYHKR